MLTQFSLASPSQSCLRPQLQWQCFWRDHPWLPHWPNSAAIIFDLQQHLTQLPTPSFLKPSFTWLWDTSLGFSSVEGPSKFAVLPQGGVFGSLLYLHLPWKWANSVYGFKYQLYADHGRLKCSPEFQTHVSNCLVEVIAWIFNRHLRKHVAKPA